MNVCAKKVLLLQERDRLDYSAFAFIRLENLVAKIQQSWNQLHLKGRLLQNPVGRQLLIAQPPMLNRCPAQHMLVIDKDSSECDLGILLLSQVASWLEHVIHSDWSFVKPTIAVFSI
jgi:hypothetical protein